MEFENITKITSRKNPIVQKYKALIRDKKTRHEHDSFICEGVKLCSDAIENGLVPKSGLFTPNALLKHGDLRRNPEISVISGDLAGYISDTKAPQGIFFEFSLSAVDKTEKIDKIINNAKKLILLDGLQDTGNVGTIIRTADAFGVDAVIMSDDCPDIFSGKVLRGSMGSVFRIPIITGALADIIKVLMQNRFDVFACVLNEDAEILGQTVFSPKSAIIIGNEGNGISDDIIRLCNKKIYIPIKNAQSLNAGVAASVFLWELSKYNYEKR